MANPALVIEATLKVSHISKSRNELKPYTCQTVTRRWAWIRIPPYTTLVKFVVYERVRRRCLVNLIMVRIFSIHPNG